MAEGTNIFLRVLKVAEIICVASREPESDRAARAVNAELKKKLTG
jgi:hypothetical protein